MRTHTRNLVYVLQEGSVQEEAWALCDVEAMCRAGKFSGETLIFIPGEGDWARVADTRFARFFDDAPPADDDVDSEEVTQLRTSYDELLEIIADRGPDTGLLIDAAELAVALGDRDAAGRHFQRALDRDKYDPRVVQGIKRHLPPSEWRAFRFFDRPDPSWEHPLELLAYPLKSGWHGVVVPVIVLFALTGLPWTRVFGAVLVYAWTALLVDDVMRGGRRPPRWKDLLSNLKVLVAPLVVGIVFFAALVLPFAAVAEALIVMGKTTAPNIWLFISRSPVVMVLLFTAVSICVPAVLVVTVMPDARLGSALRPTSIVAAIRRMQLEYVVTLAVFFLFFGVWAVTWLGLEFLPVVGHLLASAVGVYGLMLFGWVVGRLGARYQEGLAVPRSHTADRQRSSVPRRTSS